jgi:hypothetical protein
MGFIHSKMRYSLASKAVQNLVIIKSNLNAFYDYPAPEDGDNAESTSESDNEDDAAVGAELEEN